MTEKHSQAKIPLGQRAFGEFSWPDGVVPTVLAGDPIPLKIGLGQELAALLPEAEHDALRSALARWTRGFPYHCATAEPGAKRYDIDGKPVEEVSKKEREHALGAIAKRQLARAREQSSQIISALDAIDEMFKNPSSSSLAAAKKGSAEIRRILTSK